MDSSRNSHLLQVEIQTMREGKAKKWSRQENGMKGDQFTNLVRSFRIQQLFGQEECAGTQRSEALEIILSFLFHKVWLWMKFISLASGGLDSTD